MKLRNLAISLAFSAIGFTTVFTNDKTKSFIWGNGVY